MINNEILASISNYLFSHFQMTIATYGDHLWIAIVYYSSDSDLNMYFLSDPQTLHCQQIAQNPQVAVSIADSPQKPAVKKVGLQISGRAEQIKGKKKIIHALNLWKQTLNVDSSDYSYEGMMKKLIKGRMYKVIPERIKFFNENLWEEGEEPTINL